MTSMTKKSCFFLSDYEKYSPRKNWFEFNFQLDKVCAHVKSVITADLSMLIGEFPGQIFFKMLDEND